jgi:uncharacterized protein (DUF2235 family)
VQSVGLVPKHLPFSGSNNAILHFRHALALDERRVKFIPFFYTLAPDDKTDTKSAVSEPVTEGSHHKGERRERHGASYEYENRINAMSGPNTDVEEVFFAGVHCGTSRYSHTREIRYLPFPSKMLAVDPCQTVNVTASPASPFDG